VKSIYKGLLPKQHIKYKTKKLANYIMIYMYMLETYVCLTNDI